MNNEKTIKINTGPRGGKGLHKIEQGSRREAAEKGGEKERKKGRKIGKKCTKTYGNGNRVFNVFDVFGALFEQMCTCNYISLWENITFD